MGNPALERQLIDEFLQEIESGSLVLPTLPEVALRIRDAIDDDNSTSTSISKEIANDAALTAKLIQAANSPLARGNKTIESVEVAVTRLGNSMVKNLINGLIVQQIFQPTTEVSDTLFRKFWEHSSQVAAISHALATFARLPPDQAMLAGLVHDIGALPIIKKAEDIPELLEDVALLESIIARNHGKIGKAILDTWGFPEGIAAVAIEHENLQRKNEGKVDFVDVITVANLQSYVGDDSHYTDIQWSDVFAFEKLGLDTDISIVDMDEHSEAIEQVKSVLS